MRLFQSWLAVAAIVVLPGSATTETANSVTYRGESGPGAGKHVVFIASDHEYRGEETCPALARILAKHYGFQCTVIFGTNPETGFLEPGSSNVSGLEVLAEADLLCLFLRFQDFPAEQMQHFVAYVDSGKPIIGLRTSTHAFQIRRGPYQHYTHDYAGPEYEKGFGRQVLGETWVTHYGPNHTTSARMILEQPHLDHPVLTGVKDIWVESGVYSADPVPEGTTILARSQVLAGVTPDAPADARRDKPQPSAWTRMIPRESGIEQRVFTTTHGASRDLLNDGFRRLLVNASLWAVGLERAITPDSPIDFVGPYQPSDFNFFGAKRNVRPVDVAGWETPILGGDPPQPRANRGGPGGRRGSRRGDGP